MLRYGVSLLAVKDAKVGRRQAYILGSIGKAHDAESRAEPILEGPIVSCAIWQTEVPHAVFLTFLVPVAHIPRAVLVPVSTGLHYAVYNCNTAEVSP